MIKTTHAVGQSLLIVLLAIVASLSCNYVRSTPLPLIGDWSIEAQLTTEEGENMMIPMEEAVSLFNGEAAVFMDARNGEEYAEGHIKGAVSLPWYEAQERFMDVIPTIDPDAHIITYCDGESCHLSHELALFLKEMGFRVDVFVNGWSLWKAAGLPVEVDGE